MLLASVAWEEPHPTQSYEHVMLDEDAKAVWRSYMAALTALEVDRNADNAMRTALGLASYEVFIPSKIETSIAK